MKHQATILFLFSLAWERKHFQPFQTCINAYMYMQISISISIYIQITIWFTPWSTKDKMLMHSDHWSPRGWPFCTSPVAIIEGLILLKNLLFIIRTLSFHFFFGKLWLLLSCVSSLQTLGPLNNSLSFIYWKNQWRGHLRSHLTKLLCLLPHQTYSVTLHHTGQVTKMSFKWLMCGRNRYTCMLSRKINGSCR